MRMNGMLASAALLALAGCAGVGQLANTQTVTLRDASGRTVGTALLTPATEGVQVVLSANGLPAGTHGVHVHMTGMCDAPEFTTAGGHFNPTSRQHGFENPNGAHAGDLPNLTVDANGRGTLNGVARGVTLEGSGANSLRKPGGTALMVHAGADDYRTDPSGNSGARIACGVIPPAS
ncbi:superoxide dismutase family protein [Longimicrobium sp.]|uniref:superoxide dismutase family protein n=1 Tax=Longimicrobium sp. TaxID=2029185 RepID=UPI002E3665E8|nr:superoxide dismutase family protein [Longimicrobium sp.]HEX6042556.1 superoxide dismutase family protein [Longimicrobium sp.]